MISLDQKSAEIDSSADVIVKLSFLLTMTLRILNEELEENERKNELLHNSVEKTKEALRKEQAKLDKENQEFDAKTKESEAKEKELQVFTE